MYHCWRYTLMERAVGGDFSPFSVIICPCLAAARCESWSDLCCGKSLCSPNAVMVISKPHQGALRAVTRAQSSCPPTPLCPVPLSLLPAQPFGPILLPWPAPKQPGEEESLYFIIINNYIILSSSVLMFLDCLRTAYDC